MSYQRLRGAAFGPAKANLPTVGYTLGGGARVTAGIAETPPGSGTYLATVTIPDGFTGPIVWDTGEPTPAYVTGIVGPADPLDLAQPLPVVSNPTLGGAFQGAWAVAFGQMLLDKVAGLLSLYGSSGTAPLQTFELDNGAAPTSRTPT